MEPETSVQLQAPDAQSPRTRQDIQTHFSWGLLMGLFGSGIVAFTSFVDPASQSDLLALASWGIGLPLGFGLLAAALGDRGLAVIKGITSLLG